MVHVICDRYSNKRETEIFTKKKKKKERETEIKKKRFVHCGGLVDISICTQRQRIVRNLKEKKRGEYTKRVSMYINK